MDKMFPYPENKRYYGLSAYYKEKYGKKACRIPFNAGFGCPNRDGTCGEGGCAFCSGQKSGDFGGDPALSLAGQFQQMKAVCDKKWPDALYIAYFQAGTNTYAPAPVLRRCFEKALSFPRVVGLSVATRADCLPADVLDLLEELSLRTDLTVELGLQTVHDQTAERINRGHSMAGFLAGYHALTQRGIKVCVHLINGLPGESLEQMRETARQTAALHPFAVKIHLLHLLRGTPLAAEYEKDPFPLMEKDEYVRLVCDQLEFLPPDTVIARLTGDGDRTMLIGPMWSVKKREVLNAIHQELARRNSRQGAKYIPEEKEG